MKSLHINTQPIYLDAVLLCDLELSSHWHTVDNSFFITAIQGLPAHDAVFNFFNDKS